MTVKHPIITWAQRSPHLYLSVEVDDMKVQELSVNEDSFKIRGKRGEDVYEADLKLFGKLKGEERRQIATDRRVELVIPKEEAEWWPRLLSEKAKVAWIKVDFDKWRDEDEEKDDDLGFGGMAGWVTWEWEAWAAWEEWAEWAAWTSRSSPASVVVQG